MIHFRYATILAFDVKVERDAQELADSLGVRIFQADIIYHLFDNFEKYRKELKEKKREEFRSIAVFPCKMKVCTIKQYSYTISTRPPCDAHPGDRINASIRFSFDMNEIDCLMVIFFSNSQFGYKIDSAAIYFQFTRSDCGGRYS